MRKVKRLQELVYNKNVLVMNTAPSSCSATPVERVHAHIKRKLR